MKFRAPHRLRLDGPVQHPPGSTEQEGVMKVSEDRSQVLIILGFMLFLVGLLTGFAVPMLANPRMGLASHLEGIMNGMFLIVLGLVWTRMRLGRLARSAVFWGVLYGTFANWAATLLAAWWGAGAGMMPLAGGTFQGSVMQEGMITVLLLSLSVAMVAVCGGVLWGLARGPAKK